MRFWLEAHACRTKGTGESDQYSTDVAGTVSQVLFRHDFDAILSVMFGTISGMNSRFEHAVGTLPLRTTGPTRHPGSLKLTLTDEDKTLLSTATFKRPDRTDSSDVDCRRVQSR